MAHGLHVAGLVSQFNPQSNFSIRKVREMEADQVVDVCACEKERTDGAFRLAQRLVCPEIMSGACTSTWMESVESGKKLTEQQGE